MDVDLEFNKDNIFVSYFQPPSLKAMASYSIARGVVYNVISRLSTDASDYWEELHEKIKLKLEEDHSDLSCMKMPRPIEVIVKQSIKQVCDELYKCDGYFRESLTLTTYSIQLLDLNCCIWFPNGRIDYEKTAKQILLNGGLGQPQKFTIMSQFCMENEIRSICLCSLPKDFVNGLNSYHNDLNNHWLLCIYWLCYKKNQLNLVPRYNNHKSVNMEMASRCFAYGYKNWTAFMYFWKRLNVAEQIKLLTMHLMKYLCMYRHHPRLQILSMMSPQQQHCVLFHLPEKVIIQCAESYSEFQLSCCMLQIWKKLKSAILVTANKFAQVLFGILPIAMHNEECTEMLMEIWKNGSDHHRNYVFAIEGGKKAILNQFFPWYGTTEIPCSKAFYFLRSILSQKNTDFRRSFIFEGVSQIAYDQRNPSIYCDFISFCLPALDDQLMFKKLVTNSDQMIRSCNELLKRSAFDVLTAKLRFYLQDEANLREYVKELLGTEIETDWIYDFKENTWESQWHKFSTFIDEIYSDPLQAMQLKKWFVSIFPTKLAANEKFGCHWECARKVAEFVLVGDELTSFKRDFACTLAECFRPPKTDKYNNMGIFNSKEEFVYWNIGPNCLILIENVLWCYDKDENAIKDFKNQIVPVDVVFNIFFKYFEEWLEWGREWGKEWDESLNDLTESLGWLEEYLKWYMPNDHERIKYKMARINKPDDFDFFDKLVEYENVEGEEENALFSLDIILRWCCDNDQQMIDELKSKHPKLNLRMPLNKKV